MRQLNSQGLIQGDITLAPLTDLMTPGRQYIPYVKSYAYYIHRIRQKLFSDSIMPLN